MEKTDATTGYCFKDRVQFEECMCDSMQRGHSGVRSDVVCQDTHIHTHTGTHKSTRHVKQFLEALVDHSLVCTHQLRPRLLSRIAITIQKLVKAPSPSPVTVFPVSHVACGVSRPRRQ